MAMGLIGGLSLILLGAVIAGVTAAAARGRIGRNGAVGIRTSATLTSERAWTAGHRAATRPAVVLGVLCAGIGAAMAALGAVRGTDEPGTALVVLFALGYGVVVLGGTVWVATVASRAARRAEGPAA